MGGPVEMTPKELESSLQLPLDMDEDQIAKTVLQTNRAPLVLAFAVELLRHTMPEQPLSSRLSLGQAVVSANSRTKAVNLGLDKGPSADEEGWGEGQPRVRVMGREVAVLKRGGYEWRGEEEVGEEEREQKEESTKEPPATTNKAESSATSPGKIAATTTATPVTAASSNTWAVSQPISLKKSTFVARAITLSDPTQRRSIIQSLMTSNPSLQTATHNAWAYRTRVPGDPTGGRMVREDSFDDGESGCGDLMLRVMREADVVDTLVVLTRWYGGIMLGPDRWRLMRNVVSGALSERLRRKTGLEGVAALGGEAVWGLDLEAMRKTTGGSGNGAGSRAGGTGVVGMQIHKPEAARGYLLRSFNTAPGPPSTSRDGATGKTPQKKTIKAMETERKENLGLLLGALRIVFDSWADHLSAAELDRRAWAWYVSVRPDVDSGPAGYGAKGVLRLADILNLKRKE